jgi:hypothetical protein
VNRLEGRYFSEPRPAHWGGSGPLALWNPLCHAPGAIPLWRGSPNRDLLYQPQPMCSGRYTTMPTTMVPRIPRRQK